MDDRTSLHSSPRLPGCDVQARQSLEGACLHQTVELRRPGGAIWHAYARAIALPAEEEPRARLVRQATIILDLAAAAIAAVEAARLARGSALDQIVLASRQGTL